LARAASFYLIAFVTGERDALRNPHGMPAHMARRLLIIVVPACGSALVLRLVAFFFFEREATGMLRTWRNKSLVRLAMARRVELLSVVPSAPMPVQACQTPSDELSVTQFSSSDSLGARYSVSDVVYDDEPISKSSLPMRGSMLFGGSRKKLDPDFVKTAWACDVCVDSPAASSREGPREESPEPGKRPDVDPWCFLDQLFQWR